MKTAGNSQILQTITFFIIIFSLSLPAYAQYSGGTGEPNDPYQIDTAEDLMLLGETPEDYDKNFILTADIDLDPNLPGRKVFDRAVIAPDTNDVDTDFQGISFTGIFDGNGHTISHLTITGVSYLGLFGHTQGAIISDLGLLSADVNGVSNKVGIIVGDFFFGHIAASYSTGTIKGNDNVGGLAGYSWGNITTSYSAATVTGNEYVGGLVGYNWGSITTSCNTGTVSGFENVGAIVGFNIGSVAISYSTSTINGTYGVGGLVGINFYGEIAMSYSVSSVEGFESVGGIAGINSGDITTSYNTGIVNGARGVGGLVGVNYLGEIATSYNAGPVAGDEYVGGLVAVNDEGKLDSSFWDTQTSGQAISDDIGLTTAEMQTAVTFLEAGWDFVDETKNGMDDIWKMWDGYDYPRLAWEPGPNTPLVFVDINDTGFYGQMSKYEVTNAQYCDFLNAALESGEITVDGNDVYGANSSNSGEDYVGQRYYRCDGSGYSGYGATNGGASRIHYSEGAFSVDEGFGNHPVTYVSWYGAMAFCNYYGYYLPTEEQWQAVADYDGTYIYGCGQTIDPGIANYRNSEHPEGTASVGSFGVYGYGMSDMAGNVWEWTSSSLDGNRIFRGGSMGSIDSDCAVSIRGDGIPHANYWDIGFRVCR